MVFDWHDHDNYPGPARCIDVETGKEVECVFWYDTESRWLARFIPSPAEPHGIHWDQGKVVVVEERKVLNIIWLPEAGFVRPFNPHVIR